jgi:hypothetical protein
MTYKTCSGLDDWIHYTLYTALGTTDSWSAIADLHTSQFSVAHALGFSVYFQ